MCFIPIGSELLTNLTFVVTLFFDLYTNSVISNNSYLLRDITLVLSGDSIENYHTQTKDESKVMKSDSDFLSSSLYIQLLRNFYLFEIRKYAKQC